MLDVRCWMLLLRVGHSIRSEQKLLDARRQKVDVRCLDAICRMLVSSTKHPVSSILYSSLRSKRSEIPGGANQNASNIVVA